ncbi:hypothetical protein SUGI_0016420 [Cryptomeria japonica]|nr:hypothetical protein SUGI_0016420 [Cryptomeria japonica]
MHGTIGEVFILTVFAESSEMYHSSLWERTHDYQAQNVCSPSRPPLKCICLWELTCRHAGDCKKVHLFVGINM